MVIGCALGFGLLAVVVNGQSGVAFDTPVTTFVMGLPLPTEVWLLATYAGGVASLPAVVLVGYLLWARQYRMAVVVVVVLVATAGATTTSRISSSAHGRPVSRWCRRAATAFRRATPSPAR